jgi:nicotinate-nucleotide pyrophosphorylase
VETAGAYAASGVDLLSTSQITQSAPALDIGLDIR